MITSAPPAEKSSPSAVQPSGADEESELVASAAGGSEAGDVAQSGAAEDDTKAEFDEQDVRRVWVRRGHSVYPVDVVVGLTDGSKSEILAGDLEPGMQVVLAEDRNEVVTEGTNPLAPPRLRGKKKKES